MVADGDGVAVDGDWEDGDRIRRVSKDENVRTWWEACKSTGPTQDDDCEAMETTTIEKSMNGALLPNLNREHIRPSDTCLPQRGAQLPASELTPPTNRAHSPLSEEGSINWEIPLPPADIHSQACQQRLGTHELLGSSNITRGSTSLLHPTTCEHVTSMGGAKPLKGLQPPVLRATGALVTGADTDKLRLQNKQQHHLLQDRQIAKSYWTTHTGKAVLPPKEKQHDAYLNEMCPAGIATAHPAGALLAEWATMGCPTRTGRPWTKKEIWEAVERGPHQSTLSPDAIVHFLEESAAKIKAGQAKLVLWNDIKDDPPTQLKISPIAAIPTNQKLFGRSLTYPSSCASSMAASLSQLMAQQSSLPQVWRLTN
jgi:hypothetical protein